MRGTQVEGRGISRRLMLLGGAVAASATSIALAACGGAGKSTELPVAKPLTKENITLTWAIPGNAQEVEVYQKVADIFTRA